LNQQINTSLEKNPQAQPYLGGSLESLCEYRFGLFGKEHHFYFIPLGPAISNTLHPSLVVAIELQIVPQVNKRTYGRHRTLKDLPFKETLEK
jgi:hypothetical protein